MHASDLDPPDLTLRRRPLSGAAESTASRLAVVDAVTRREFLGLVAAAGLVVACGDDDDGAGAGDAATTRTVRTDAGTVDVPAEPARVVAAIGSFETDMVAVGVMPILTTSFAGPWVDLDDSVTITDNIPPTAEELLELRPDLVVGWSWVTQEPSFDEISTVAPYVGLGESAATAGPGFDGSEPMRSWDALFLSVADAVGRRTRGEEMVAEFEEVAATPLFQAIPAVQAGNVHLVDADLWPGLGHLWARALLDDLEHLFLP